ncbi:MAG TPA: TIGR03545 family protein [Planctomycetaceae bacterium]|nr:TIGR03545 family protein [Planctomycetaceae bacterium]
MGPEVSARRGAFWRRGGGPLEGRVIRWRYLGPRLALLALVAVGLWVAVDPLVERALVSFGQKLTGARVEVGDVDTWLLGPRIELSDLQVADPQRPQENLFELSQAVLELEPGPLLDRKLIVRRALVRGLRFNTLRTTSGELPQDTRRWSFDLQWDGSALAETGLSAFRQLATAIRQDMENQFESPALLRRTAEWWQAELNRLEKQVESLVAQVQELQSTVESVATLDNPVQQAEAFQRVLYQATETRSQFAQAVAQLKQLQEQWPEDRRQLEEAARRDAERIEQLAQWHGLAPQALSHYMLGPEAEQRLVRTLAWIEMARRYLPRRVQQRRPVRGRGTTYVFPGPTPLPDLLVQSLLVEGEGTYGGRPWSFAGRVEGLTPQPWIYGRPTRLAARARGAIEMTVQVYLDNRPGGCDRFVLNCPRLKQPGLMLGRPGEVALRVAPATARASAVVDVTDQRLEGRLDFEQDDLQLALSLPQQLGGQPLATVLSEALNDVRSLRLSVSLVSQGERIRCRLETDFGQQLAEAFDRAARGQLQRWREEALARLNRQMASQLAALDETLRVRQHDILNGLELGEQQIQRVKQQALGGRSLERMLLGRDLPLGDLLR